MWKTFSSQAFDMRHFYNMRGSALAGARSPAQAELGQREGCPYLCTSRISIYRQRMDVDTMPRSHPAHPQIPPTYPYPASLPPRRGPKAELVLMAPRLYSESKWGHTACELLAYLCCPHTGLLWMSLAMLRGFQLLLEGEMQCEIGHS